MNVFCLLWFGVAIAEDLDSVQESVSFQPAPTASTVQHGQEWMREIPRVQGAPEVQETPRVQGTPRVQETLGDRLLSELSIPGTHDSCALLNGFSFGYAKCQSWPLEQQLNAGIRFLDIRCRHLSDKFQIYHGVIDQKMSFQNVLRICDDFLRKHPSECLVMSVKEESSSEGVTRTFRETFLEEINPWKNRWMISGKTPTLNEARGHIVLVDRVGNLGGLDWRNMNRQDDYQALPEVKQEKIKQHFVSRASAVEDGWFLNYCSGTVPSRFLNPKAYASIINPFLLRELRQNRSRTLGVVVMDFPGDSLVQQIIQANFQTSENELQRSED
jgi:1-phosphatidylinositol phosphodiesterase